jgi:hypothetical protein
MNDWQVGKPPNETPVEVEHDGKIIIVEAFYGRDGYLPHWRTLDGSTCWAPSRFKKWRISGEYIMREALK